MRRLVSKLLDRLLGWSAFAAGTVLVGDRTAVAYRRIHGARGNNLKIGNDSIIHANMNFEAVGGNIRIGDRCFIGRSNLVCYRNIAIGDDVIMSWGITIVDHDSHSTNWSDRKNDVRDWAVGKKDWSCVAHSPVTIEDKVWIGFNASLLKGIRVGEGAVIAACSVVTRDVPPYSLVAGCPARVVRELAPGDEARRNG